MSGKRQFDLAIRDAIHWALVRQRGPDHRGENADGFVEMQALHCPHYVPLEGEWGADWGAIMHPQSERFGQLVFEHDWCGCSFHGDEDAA